MIKTTIRFLNSKKYSNTRRIHIKHKKTARQQLLFFLGAILVFFVALSQVNIDFSYLQKGVGKINMLLLELSSPNLSALPAFLFGLMETLSIAFVGLAVSATIALPLVFLSASNTSPNKTLAKGIRLIMVIVRAVPITIWGLIAAASVGFGSLAGILGLFFPITAYLVRTLTNRVEENSNEVIEALQSTGATWLQVMLKGVFIQIYPQFLASITLRYEMNVAEVVSLGMVGIAGIGYRLNMSISMYDFNTASTGIIIVYCTMLLLEIISKRIVIKIKGV
ncbi:PhnE/PtxC family ABC transporter permease [Culicoidibacter larvae]|uniref:ABC transporter permease subunit n=1 Tax=Culicoidibacter larvae TaxID=2579976 RepID=A0A5R8QES4_9FIRM|nr:ABC transporter permease subunit [Culicoidibacter larvae]TLG75476.1 ABC transporter permease subunit [Culicoidibacter larvae]